LEILTQGIFTNNLC